MFKQLAGLLKSLGVGFLGGQPSQGTTRTPDVAHHSSSQFRPLRSVGTECAMPDVIIAPDMPHSSVVSDKPDTTSPILTAAPRDRDALWIDKFLTKAQQLPKRVTTPASIPLAVKRLLELPPELHRQLIDLSSTTVVPSGLVAALWRNLEANTRKYEQVWCFVQTDGRFDYNDDVIPETVESVDFVLGRFRDVLLVKNSALLDQARSYRHNAPHFLHANNVNLACGRRFVAGQKPVSGEIPGFQQMLIDENVGLIVDLTRDKENHQTGVYIPERKEKFLVQDGSQILVSCIKTVKLKELPGISQCYSIDNGTSITEVRRLHFREWPDHGVIPAAQLIALAGEVEAMGSGPQRPIFIHCMAGMGRTGTLMSFLSARTRIEQELLMRKQALNTETVLRLAMEVVARGRTDRGPSFVQTEGQFTLLIRALLKDLARNTPYEQ